MSDFKRNTMKKILIAAWTAMVICTAGCQKLLEEDVKSQISNLYLDTPAGLEDGVRGCYSYLRTWYGGQSSAWLTIFGTDEYQNGNADVTYPNYTANLNPANSVTSGVWNNMYLAINSCNAVVEAAPAIAMDQTLKNRRVGEARFLRAHYYFILLQQFGPIHISLKPTSTADNTASRSPVAEVYKVIIDDLNFAVANLPATTPDYGRVTSPIAKHMLSKVYLTRAGGEARETGDYDQAATLAKDVIANSGYKLVDNFSDLFAQPLRPNTENMWACQYSSSVVTGGYASNTACFQFNMGYELPGMIRDLANGRPFAHFRPTNWMINLYNKTADSRWEKSFKTVWFCNNPGTYTINGKSVTLKRRDTCIVTLDRDLTPAQRNARPYHVFTPSTYTAGQWPMNKKYEDSLRVGLNDASGKDFTIYRLAETYLLAAEALVMTNKPGEAADLINKLRARSTKTGATPAATEANRLAMQVSAADMTLDFILDERARELSGELTRWTDLVRTGKLLERVKKYNPVAALNIREHHVLRPIPQDQIDRTKGGSASFPQNPGY
jgi:starch-binding outer membrane protein, SusD/RagB family